MCHKIQVIQHEISNSVFFLYTFCSTLSPRFSSKWSPASWHCKCSSYNLTGNKTHFILYVWVEGSTKTSPSGSALNQLANRIDISLLCCDSFRPKAMYILSASVLPLEFKSHSSLQDPAKKISIYICPFLQMECICQIFKELFPLLSLLFCQFFKITHHNGKKHKLKHLNKHKSVQSVYGAWLVNMHNNTICF